MAESLLVQVEYTLSISERVLLFLDEKADPRTKDWFLINSFPTLASILIIYVFFCKILGPWLMEGREPFVLKKPIIVYNAMNIIANIYILYECLDAGWLRGYRLMCEPVDYSDHPQALRMARMGWLFFILKVFELLDTVFFALRKKTNQISFLHVHHHTGMPILIFLGVKYFAGGHGSMIILLNSIVHIVMYSYYLIAALGPAYKKYLWWKRYITIMQLAQFVLLLIHFGETLFIECDLPKILMLLLCLNDIFMIYLFGDFYVQTYMRKPKVA